MDEPRLNGVKPRHAALAVLVATIWGVNFVAIELGLRDFPPLLFSGLRFLAAAVPALFLVGPPRVAWRWVVAVGLVLGVAKFGFVFSGMHAGMPAGLSSLVLQSQAVFTVVFAAVLLRERPRRTQLVGIGVASAGILVIALDYGVGSPLGAFLLVIAGAACWGLSNVITRHAKPPDALSFIVWVSAVAVLPLFALSLLIEGPSADLAALRGFDWSGAAALGFVAWVSTLLGFGLWGFLLREYDASTVAPFSLLVPVAGMLSAWVFLGEELTVLRCTAGLLVVAGMASTAIKPRDRVPVLT
ncbi:O-acetylserine/cysteine efflux transporter [Umezawaea tangerina]|uniref:O-acetylserine/cysteine efflux transporter n=1 Tax=Umezawaea tangerina TaxID=84725 RepID=A0A2T0TAD7_9PSEU|nr:O-acetylserine/cysteine efflux transporter [Umezawaea tangerina]